MDDYQGSIAQENVSFGTSVALETIPGDNFYKLMVFVGLSQVGESLNEVPIAETILEFNSSSFASETKGLLNAWLTAFFAGAGASKVYVVVFKDLTALDAWDPDGLTNAMEQYKMLAYWKAVLYYPASGGNLVLTAQDIVAYPSNQGYLPCAISYCLEVAYIQILQGSLLSKGKILVTQARRSYIASSNIVHAVTNRSP